MYSLWDAEGHPTPASLLRPQCPPVSEVEALNSELASGGTHGVSSVDLEAIEQVFNEVLIEHASTTSCCEKGFFPKLVCLGVGCNM